MAALGPVELDDTYVRKPTRLESLPTSSGKSGKKKNNRQNWLTSVCVGAIWICVKHCWYASMILLCCVSDMLHNIANMLQCVTLCWLPLVDSALHNVGNNYGVLVFAFHVVDSVLCSVANVLAVLCCIAQCCQCASLSCIECCCQCIAQCCQCIGNNYAMCTLLHCMLLSVCWNVLAIWWFLPCIADSCRMLHSVASMLECIGDGDTLHSTAFAQCSHLMCFALCWAFALCFGFYLMYYITALWQAHCMEIASRLMGWGYCCGFKSKANMMQVLVRVSVSIRKDVFSIRHIFPKRPQFPVLSALSMGYVQNSRSGCKYTKSFWTLMETLVLGASCLSACLLCGLGEIYLFKIIYK